MNIKANIDFNIEGNLMGWNSVSRRLAAIGPYLLFKIVFSLPALTIDGHSLTASYRLLLNSRPISLCK
jgi:hypothetical protein